jgi:S1-C subfamily serine protease
MRVISRRHSPSRNFGLALSAVAALLISTGSVCAQSVPPPDASKAFATTPPDQSVDFRIRGILGGMSAQELQARAEQLVGLYGTARIGEPSAEELKARAWEGDTFAQYRLGRCYYLGQGVPKDSAEAVKWFRKAANQGNASAQCALGVCYGVGQGVLQDHFEAARWYRKAAEQGNASSQYLFGVCCYAGLGAAKSDEQAYKWFNIAATYGDEITAKYAFRARDLLSPILSRAEIVEAQREAADFVPQIESQSSVTSPAAPKDGSPRSSGTGFFVSEDGYFLTAFHVVADAARIAIRTKAGTFEATLVKADKANDVALLKVAVKSAALYLSLSSLPVESSRGVTLGESVFTIGFPNIELQGFAPKLTKGEISSLTGMQDDPREFQISVPVQPGNSGGPLVNRDGNVVGIVEAQLADINTLKTTGSLPQNVNYAIKSSALNVLLESLPEISAKLPEPNLIKDRKFEDVEKEAESAVALVLVY